MRWGVPWYEAFGMIESRLDIAAELDAHDETVGTGCVGTPMPGREARMVDADDRPVPTGTAEELVLCGVGLMDGYCRNPAATADAFRNGRLHTGDVVRCDARGRFHYLSRTKDMIRRSGENIAAAEVEEAIMRHPGVRLAALLAVEDDLRGEEVMAYVVPGDDLPHTPSERIRKEALREEHDIRRRRPGIEWRNDGDDGVQVIINADRPVILPILSC